MKKMGFTLVEIMLVISVIALLASLSIPSIMKARRTARTNTCINNLRQLEEAKEQAAMETNLNEGSPCVTTMLDPFIKQTTSGVICPADIDKSFDTSYSIEIIGSKPLCVNVPESHFR
jgi:prepilin-type N-terminal cleavage/methylation domain-containing protein